MEIGDEQFSFDAFAEWEGYAVALVAHYDDAALAEFLFVDVATVEQRAIDAHTLFVGLVQQLAEVFIYNMYARNATHRCLYNFRRPAIGRIDATHHLADAKPVGDTDDCAQIPWVLHTV